MRVAPGEQRTVRVRDERDALQAEMLAQVVEVLDLTRRERDAWCRPASSERPPPR